MFFPSILIGIFVFIFIHQIFIEPAKQAKENKKKVIQAAKKPNIKEEPILIQEQEVKGSWKRRNWQNF